MCVCWLKIAEHAILIGAKGGSGPISSFRFSTADLPAHERHNAIRQLRERGIMPIEPLPDEAVSVQVNKCFLPGASILSGTLCGVLRKEICKPLTPAMTSFSV
jgi:hypothetical protein